jgi:photosystem II stability/assembly factor-like uncharacterized protein
MNRNRLIVVSLSLLAVISTLTFWTLEDGTLKGRYSKKGLPFIEYQSVDDFQKWIEARYIDQSTGLPINPEKLELIRKQFRMSPRSKSITFMEQGPDNIGGRTRAIQIDRSDRNKIWAGGVSGGLFVSTNRGNQWSRVESYINAGGSPMISSMTQTPDGTLFVSTGFNGAYTEPFTSGNGVWYSTDKGSSWAKIPATSSCLEVESSDVNNFVWLATSSGLKKWKIGDASITPVSAGSSAFGECTALKVSKDGQVIVAAFNSNKVFVSYDGGDSWTNKSGTGSGLIPGGASRLEFAISPSKENGNYSIYAVRTGENLDGMHVSHDNGNTWSQFVGASGTPSNLDIYRDQGKWNSVISVLPNNNEKVLIGGIDIWQWKQTVNSPPSGGFEGLTYWFLPPYSPKYAHADNHEMKWDDLNRLYIGNDGGIGITDDYGQTWFPANRGYNVTQFYGIAFDKDGALMGGTQDNGTIYNDGTLSTKQEFKEVSGGDGFECEISFYNSSVMFSSVYYNFIQRSGDKGETWKSFKPRLPGNYDPITGTQGSLYHPFHTEFVLAEYYDTNSKDSVKFIPTQNYTVGSKINVPSMSTGNLIKYTTPKNLYFDDTVLYDPVSTKLDVSVVNKLNEQTVYLGNFTYTSFPSSSGTNPPAIGDSLMVNFPTGADTVVVKSIGSYKHYYAKNQATGKKYSLGNDSIAFNIAWDTVIVQDPFQSWFLVYINGTSTTKSANGGELWGTRNALRLTIADTAKQQQWVCIAKGVGGSITSSVDIEFSKDLNHCYVSCGNGIYRIDGLSDIYSSDPQFMTKAGFSWNPSKLDFSTPPTSTTKTLIATGSYEGLAVNPSNKDDVVLFAGFGGTNRRSLNASSATPTFTALPSLPAAVATYDGIIDRDDSDIIVLGTSEGVYVTEDGGGKWENASTGFEGTPVYEVRQSWRTWDEGNRRPGEIYIGTFGRGIWSSATYLGVDDLVGNGDNAFKTKLKTYPNPTNDNTVLTFNLEEISNVNVYVYSISGSLVKTISRKNMDSGSQTITIDGEDLQRGTYIVKLNAGKQNDTVKFIKL